MHADIDECTERGDVGHYAFQYHLRTQILDLVHTLLEDCGGEFGARVAARLFKFAQDVSNCRYAVLFIRVLGWIQRFQ
jgi:hypothetical protein